MTGADAENKLSHDVATGTLCSAMSDAQDREALALLERRDPRGFDVAYARYSERIFGFLVRLSKSRVVAEDLFQQTFLRLAEAGPSLRPDSDLRAWLFSVARNAYYGYFRTRGVEARAGDTLHFERGSSAFSPDSGLALSELERALCRLPADVRELLLLIGVEGLSHGEVARILNIDQVTVRKRVSRARARLAAALDEAPVSMPKSKVSQ